VSLKEACRTIDLLDSLQAAIDRDGPLQRWGEGSRAILRRPSCATPHRASEAVGLAGYSRLSRRPRLRWTYQGHHAGFVLSSLSEGYESPRYPALVQDPDEVPEGDEQEGDKAEGQPGEGD
jgi:hypothetical protein